MWVFIKGIPEEMDSKALERFIKHLLSPAWLPFRMSGRMTINGTKILKIVHTRTQSIEYHGLIRVLPSDKVDSIIARINQAQIDGRQLHSHPYSRRFTRTDRRRLSSNEAREYRHDRRQVERRRKHLVSQVVDASF